MIDPHESFWESWLDKWFNALLWIAVVVNAGALWITILEPDGALYATIAKTMSQTGDFIRLTVEGKDWLDKPHFPFWMAAISFRILGVSGFAYKLPALLFWGAGAWYTYRLAMLIYGKTAARLATLIYVSAAHLVISNNDVRAEPYLTALTIGAVYHFFLASGRGGRGGAGGIAGSEGHWDGNGARMGFHLVIGSLLAGCAIMTKGPFVLITIVSGLVIDWVLTKDWAQFLSWRWWAALALTGIFIIPEIYCLYVQFDKHPELEVFGRKGVSGIRFFFWDSQFGRFFNTGPIKGSGDPLFYFHTLLWAFLPWSLLLYAAFGQKLAGLMKLQAASHKLQAASHKPQAGDWICAGSALVSFLIFSLSRFQLPHYLNILFPFFSIVTAGWLYRVRKKSTEKAVRITQGILNWLLPLLLLFLCWWTRFAGWEFVAVVVPVVVLAIIYFLRGPDPWSVFGRSFSIAMLVYAFVNFYLYPGMLQYQAGTEAGRFAEESGDLQKGKAEAEAEGKSEGKAETVLIKEAPANYSFEFYCPGMVPRIPMDSLPRRLQKGRIRVFIPSAYRDSLAAKGYTVNLIRKFENFHVSQLTGAFLDWRTRDSVTESWGIYSCSSALGP
jgi:4-amino-4-deoxy-L-arabinose transferase-like glycosyltransferase